MNTGDHRWVAPVGDLARSNPVLKQLGEVALPRNPTGSPMTYMLDGKQFIVVTTGGANLPAELVVLALP
jgi:hypothetical protein